MRLPVWALAIGFAVAEHLVVHVHFRRSSHSMSLGEIPLVFALLYSGGWTVVIAYTVGRACALVILRLPAVRLVFNAAQFALGRLPGSGHVPRDQRQRVDRGSAASGLPPPSRDRRLRVSRC